LGTTDDENKTTCTQDIYKNTKLLPSVAHTEKLPGDISKNVKSKDTPHSAHYYN
jgi:hypothetical protein